MKRIILSVVFLLLCATVQAGEVDMRTARRVAASFWNTYHPADVKPVAEGDMVSMAYDGISHVYVFTVGQEGFVIVSDDDRVEPVLAYSFDSHFPKELHPTLRYLLGLYESQLTVVAQSDAEGSAEAAASWQKLLFADDEEVDDTEPLLNIPAMVTTRWDQVSPYNKYCPYDTNYNARTVVGCVATAMAQIIRYWRYPSCGAGNNTYVPPAQSYEGQRYTYPAQSADFAHTTYVYDYMPNWLEEHNTPEREVNAVATLSYHCGVAVNMMYGTMSQGGSGAYSEDAATAFVQYFKYKPNISRVYRAHYPDDSVWRAMINEDLAAGRPIYYTGRDDDGGHAFVLDGADLQGRYHFNLGWSGSGDGFYYFNDISIGHGGAGGNPTYTFNLEQSAIFGLEPMDVQMDTVDVYDTVCPDVNTYYFYEYDIPAQNGVYDFVHLDTVYRVHLNKAQSRYIYLNSNGGSGNIVTMSFCVLNGAVLPECTFTRAGYRFLGWCRSPEGDEEIYMAGDTLRIRRNLSLYAIWEDTVHVGIAGHMALDAELTVWPNPTTGEVTVTVPTYTGAVIVTDMLGREVLRREGPQVNGGSVKISLAGLADGVYMLQVRSAAGVYKQRIIKR